MVIKYFIIFIIMVIVKKRAENIQKIDFDRYISLTKKRVGYINIEKKKRK